jgi:hypothetical protein
MGLVGSGDLGRGDTAGGSRDDGRKLSDGREPGQIDTGGNSWIVGYGERIDEGVVTADGIGTLRGSGRLRGGGTLGGSGTLRGSRPADGTENALDPAESGVSVLPARATELQEHEAHSGQQRPIEHAIFHPERSTH